MYMSMASKTCQTRGGHGGGCGHGHGCGRRAAPAVSVVATPAGTSSTAASTPVASAAPIPAATAASAVPTDVSILNPAAYEKLSDTNKESKAAFWWKHEDIEVPDYPFTSPQPGPANCPPQLTLLAAFHTLWPDSLLDHIVSKTNLYVRTHQNIDDFKNFSAVTKAGMYTYFSIMLGMCITGKPVMKEHWMHDKLVGTE